MSEYTRLYELILQNQKDVETNKAAIAAILRDLSNRPYNADITALQTEFRDSLQTLGILMVRLEKKLELLNLPEDTRYYLEEAEITKLRDSTEEMKRVLTELMKMRQSLIGMVTSALNK